ncbi:hypothetical protein BDV28DRAFT_135560 [Aspergillus coremiiformis]|uniref:Myb-like domain-containing protein n=1 Tax=Aspergillus coremiiformis TaxID=138285 RepID=A0A5N6Z3C6_9EURO|nr:hypothetical protein BDV28DRAFT_135560 [Aspergillus coremiiformis]
MSSSSLYELDEDDEASDSDIEVGNALFRVPHSSLPSHRIRSPSTPQLDGVLSSKRVQKSKRVSRMQMLERLQTSLSKQSVGAYSDLLVQTANDDASVESKVGSGKYQSTQAGIVIWTSKEKEIFFNTLDRKGKDGVRDIACAIGSKSELEVREYIRLLHSRLEWQHLVDQHSRTVVLGDVPAAEEISGECCDMLSKYAKLLALQEQQDDDVAGRHKHHDMWIIDREKAQLLEDIESQDENLSSCSSVYHTAGLLNIPKWIRLSERFFMNFGGPRLEDNWVNVAYADESPAMTAEAIEDFYALTISVTRRLIQSALFFAMSRMRNMRETGNTKAKVVKSRDVRAALDVLKMNRDGFDYWVGLARRCNLDVSDFRHRKGWKSVCLSHDEVEDMLSGKTPIDTESNQSTSRQRSESRLRGDTDGDHTDSNEGGSDSDGESEFEHTPTPLSSPEVSGDEEEFLSDFEDKHAEQEDQKASCLGELELWKALDRPAPAFLVPMKQESQEDKSRKPVGERKTKQELVDWRERTLYRSNWEEYGHEIHDIYEELSENRRKRRRLDNSRNPSPSVVDDYDEQIDEVNIDSTPDEDEQIANEDITPAEDNHEDMGMGDSTIPNQNPTLSRHEDPNFQESDSDPNVNSSQQHDQTKTDPNSNQQSNPSSPVNKNNLEYRSPILTRRRRMKAESKQDEGVSSNSDEDLPALRRYPSSGQDDTDSMPLYSQPMSPADWPSD